MPTGVPYDEPGSGSTNVTNIFVERVEFAVRGSGSENATGTITGYRTPVILTFPANWNAGTGTYTIGVTGQYRIDFRVPFSTTIDTRSNDIGMFVNGSIFTYWSGISISAPPGAPEYYTASINVLDTFVANDTIDFRGFDGAATSLNDHLWWNITRIS